MTLPSLGNHLVSSSVIQDDDNMDAILPVLGDHPDGNPDSVPCYNNMERKDFLRGAAARYRSGVLGVLGADERPAGMAHPTLKEVFDLELDEPGSFQRHDRPHNIHQSCLEFIDLHWHSRFETNLLSNYRTDVLAHSIYDEQNEIDWPSDPQQYKREDKMLDNLIAVTQWEMINTERVLGRTFDRKLLTFLIMLERAKRNLNEGKGTYKDRAKFASDATFRLTARVNDEQRRIRSRQHITSMSPRFTLVPNDALRRHLERNRDVVAND